MARALFRILSAGLIAALLGLGPLLAAQAFAQVSERAGAGADPNQPVPPGLESRTPSPQMTKPGDVPLDIPHEDKVVGRVSIPDAKLAVLVQPEGREWRAFRMETLQWVAGGLILFTVVALLAFYLIKGRIRIERGRSGRWVPRFGFFERFAHWTTAVSFIALALSGMVITFGRFLLIPLIGHDAFFVAADGAKYLHNFSSLPFVLGIVVMFLAWVRDNIPEKADVVWIRTLGGMGRGGHAEHPETGRFNAGQKGIFWGVVLGGAAVAVTGYMLMTPFAVTGIGGQQILHVVHALLAALMIAMILAHIYIGTVGMEGAFDAMGRGEVDENWAIEHHRGWYEAQRRQVPPAGVGTTYRAGAE